MKKKLLTTMAIACSLTFVNAQTDAANKNSSFEVVMIDHLKQLDTASAPTTFVSLANSFERIGNAEKNKWEPYYYASYCYSVLALSTPDKSKIDVLADKAEDYLMKAEEMEKNNSEITTLFVMINSCRILADPMGRFQSKNKEVQALLGKAKTENTNNPRIYLLQASMLLKTPEAFGGGKDVARKTAEIAIEKFNSFLPANNLAPNWGAIQAKNLLDKINNSN